MTRLRTADLYYGAYLLSKGDELKNVDVQDRGKRRVFFVFTGPDLQRHALEYVNGSATVNLKDLKSSIKHLKDIIYEDIVQPTHC